MFRNFQNPIIILRQTFLIHNFTKKTFLETLSNSTDSNFPLLHCISGLLIQLTLLAKDKDEQPASLSGCMDWFLSPLNWVPVTYFKYTLGNLVDIWTSSSFLTRFSHHIIKIDFGDVIITK